MLFRSYRKVRKGVIKNLIRNTYHGCLIAFKSELKDSIIPMPKRGCFHDQWIGMIANKKGDCIFIEEILMDYKRYENNASSFRRYPVYIQLMNRGITFINLFLFFNGLNYRI